MALTSQALSFVKWGPDLAAHPTPFSSATFPTRTAS